MDDNWHGFTVTGRTIDLPGHIINMHVQQVDDDQVLIVVFDGGSAIVNKEGTAIIYDSYAKETKNGIEYPGR